MHVDTLGDKFIC